MANISAIKLPSGSIYNIKDNVSGYITDAGVTGVKGNAESSYRTGNVNLTAANIGAIPTNTNGNTQNLLRPLQLNGLGDVTLDAKINTLRANRLAFLPADQIIIEKTTDGGSTWTDAGVADSTKVGLFSETRAGVSIPLLNGVKNIKCGLRITITGMKYNVPSGTAETSKYNYWNSNYIVSTERYNQLKEMYFWVSANSDTISVKVERATGAASTTWYTIFDNSSYGMTGWSGNDYIRFSQGVFGGGTTQTRNYWNYRLTFFTRGPGGSTTLSGTNTSSTQSISEIRGYGDTWWIAGNEYAANDKIYTHDYLKNVTFPAKVTASGGFSGNLTGNVIGNVSGSAGSVAWSGVGSKPTTLSGYGITDAKIASGVITLGSNTITPLTSSSTLSAAKLSGAIPSAVTATTQASTDNSTKIATTAYVTTAIANLPEPMVFKGSVGTGGTITSLPTAAAANEGWTYKVITALSSPVAKVGDTVISNGSEWIVIPSGDEPSGTVTSVAISNGGGLSVSGSPITSSGIITISHADTSSQASSLNSGRTYIQSLTLDTYGHVTGISTATETVADTKLQVAEVTSATQYYPIVGTGTTAVTRQYDTTGFKYKGTTGTTSANGTAILELGNSTVSGTAGNKYGILKIFGKYNANAFLRGPDINSNTTYDIAFPAKTGTIALTTDIPSVPTSATSSTTGITASTTATKTTLGTAFTIPNVTSVGSASTWSFTDITVPIRADNDTTVPTAASSATACDDITAWSAGSGSFTSGAFSGGSGSFSATVTDHVLSFSHTHTAATHEADSHTHTAPSLSYTARSITGVSGSTTVRGVKTGTSSTTTASKASGSNGSAPTLGTAFTVPNVTGNTSATVSITDNGHTHTLS